MCQRVIAFKYKYKCLYFCTISTVCTLFPPHVFVFAPNRVVYSLSSERGRPHITLGILQLLLLLLLLLLQGRVHEQQRRKKCWLPAGSSSDGCVE